MARRVETIVGGPVKGEVSIPSGSNLTRPFLPMSRSQRGHGSVGSVNMSANGKPNSGHPFKSLSQAELEDRRKKGLCFWCGLKYSPGHKCTKSQLYQLVVDPSWDNEPEIHSPSQDEFQDCVEQLDLTEVSSGNAPPVLSLQALQGLQGPTTMRFFAAIDQSQVVVLVDSGSTLHITSSTLRWRNG